MPDEWTVRLSEYIDGELSEAEVGALESHLTTCADCRDTVEQLRAVAARAADLHDRAPESDLWAGIASRIKANSLHDGSVTEFKTLVEKRRRVSFSVPQLLAAGIALMFVSAGTMWLALSGPADSSGTTAVATQSQDESAALLASFEDPGYDAAVAELERLLDAGRDRLDANTVEILEQSLATIDRAIAEARNALRTDPTNLYLSEHLSETMSQKVRLLRTAAALASSAS